MDQTNNYYIQPNQEQSYDDLYQQHKMMNAQNYESHGFLPDM